MEQCERLFLFLTILSFLVLQVVEGTCYITQWGQDGFGHQLEGKIGCMLAEELTRESSDPYIYIHSPFHHPEHEYKVEGRDIDQFINIGSIIQHPNTITGKARSHPPTVHLLISGGRLDLLVARVTRT